MKKSILLILLCMLTAAAVSSAPRNDKHAKAARKIWAAADSAFDAPVTVSDSLAASASAVILTRKIDVNAKLDFRSDMYVRSGGWNFTVLSELERVKVKLYDRSAVEHYSSFSFAERTNIKIYYYDLLTVDELFGARIHKPDGTVTEVDISESLTVADGKKGEDKKGSVIAIPGLEPGDILEYFFLTESEISELSLPPFTVDICETYPTVNFLFEGTFGPKLTVEYHTYNDAPVPVTGMDSKGNYTLRLQLQGIIGTENTRYLNKKRQYPFITFNVLNNETKMAYVPVTRRAPGLRHNLPSGTIYRDIAAWYATFKESGDIVGRASKRAKEFASRNPEASPREKTDFAWYALIYEGLRDKKEEYTPRELARCFAAMMLKLKYYPENEVGLGFINPRFEVPTEQISSWTEPEYVAFVADTIYSATGLLTCAAGEMPGRFQGESGGAYTGDPAKLHTGSLVRVFKVPALSARANAMVSDIHASIDPDKGRVRISRDVTANGASRDLFKEMSQSRDYISPIEEYLGVPESKRIGGKDDAVGREKKLREYLADESEQHLGIRPAAIESFTLGDCGYIPGQTALKFSTESVFDGLVTEGGDDLIFSVGRLFGDYSHVEDHDRNSPADAYLFAPIMNRYEMTIDIPEGYRVDNDAIEALQINVSNPVGLLFVKTEVDNEARTVSIQYGRRINYAVINSDYRPQLMDIDEAAAAFSESVLVFTPQ